jgi:hypothetical protein
LDKQKGLAVDAFCEERFELWVYVLTVAFHCKAGLLCFEDALGYVVTG